MGRYDFVSPGEMGRQALERVLLQRAMEDRQRMLDEQRQQEAKADRDLREEGLRLQRNQQGLSEIQMAQSGQAQADQRRGLEEEREFRRASTLYQTAVPGVIDPDAAALMRKQGFGGIVRQGQPTQGPQIGDAEEGVPLYDVTPGVLETTGGAQWQAQRAAEQARREAAAEAQRAAAERAEADRRSREDIAQGRNESAAERAAMMAAAQSGTNSLRNQVLQLDLERKSREEAAAARDEQQTATTKQLGTQQALSALDRLDTHPGVARITGAFEFGGFTQSARDAAALRDQVTAALALPNLAAIKGPLSDKDILFAKDLSTRLSKPGISEQEFRAAIRDAKALLGGQSIATQNGGSVPMVAPDGRALMVPPEKVQELESAGARRR